MVCPCQPRIISRTFFSTTTGALSTTDWNTFNSKQNALTTGNLNGTANQVSVSGGNGAVIGIWSYSFLATIYCDNFNTNIRRLNSHRTFRNASSNCRSNLRIVQLPQIFQKELTFTSQMPELEVQFLPPPQD